MSRMCAAFCLNRGPYHLSRNLGVVCYSNNIIFSLEAALNSWNALQHIVCEIC